MAKFLGIFGRALYQVIVVGIICLPYRLVLLVASIFNALMLPTQGISVLDGMRAIIASIAIAYKARGEWIRTGKGKLIVM